MAYIIVDLDVPADATHYGGQLTDEPSWYKCKKIAGYDHWFHYDEDTDTWKLSGHSIPHWVYEIPYTVCS